MNKQELVTALAAQSNISKAEAERRLNDVLTVVSTGLKSVGEVTLSGVGKLKVVTRNARAGRNPNTGASIQIPAKKALRVKQSSALSI